MFGLDTWIAHFSDGATLALVVVVAVVLGLCHATDPDHLAAVTTLVATGRDRAARTAARLGAADRRLQDLPAGTGAGGRRDERWRDDRAARALAARALAPRPLPPASRPRQSSRARSQPTVAGPLAAAGVRNRAR